MKAYKTGRPALLALLCALLFAALLLCAGALRARMLLRDTLDGRRARPEQEEAVSSFTLRAEMVVAQMDTRIRGWLSLVPGEETAISTKRGRLSAWVYAPVQEAEDAPWALVLHGGLGSDHRQMMDAVCMLSLAGYRVLAPDLYAHGESAGELTSLGVAEAQDVHAWVEWILMEDADARIVLLGQDEGAEAALLAACQGLPEAVKAIAADSAFLSVRERAERLLEELHPNAGRLDKWLLGAAYRAAFGVPMEAGNLSAFIERTDVPLLFIHGTGDGDVLAWQSEELAQLAGARLLFVEGAAHGMARFVDSQAYEETVLHFFESAL